MRFLKTGVTNVVQFGPAVFGTTDGRGLAPVTNLTNAGVDEIGVYKHAATALTSTTAVAITHRAGGIYTMSLTTGFVDTVGKLRFYVRDDSACLPIVEDFMVLPANVFDSLVGGTDNLQVDATQIEGTDATNQLAAAVNASTLVVAIEGLVDDIGAAGAGLTAIPWNSSWDAEVQSEVIDALNASTRLTGIEGATFNTATDSLEAIRNRGDAAWTGGSTATFPPNFAAFAITTAGAVTVGTNGDKTGYSLAADQKVDIDKINGSSVAALLAQSYYDASHYGGVAAYSSTGRSLTLSTGGSGATRTANFYEGGTVYVYSGPGAGQSRAIVSGTTALVQTLESAFAVAPTTASAVMVIPTAPGLVAPTNFSALSITTAGVVSSNATVASTSIASAVNGSTLIAAILADTDDIGVAGAGLTAVPWNSAWDAEVQSEVTDALNAYDPPTRAELTSDINGLNDLSSANVTAAVNASTLIAAIEAQTDDIGAAGAGLTAVPWNAAWDAEVQSEVNDAINASTRLTGIEGATFNTATDSLEALRNRGDVAWTGGSTATFPANFQSLVISTNGYLNANTTLIEGSDATNQLTAAVNASTAVGAIPTNPLLATAAPTNFGSLSISTAGAIGTVTSLTNKTGFSLGSTGFNAVTLSEPSAVPTWGTVTAAEGIAWNVAMNRNRMISNSTEVTLRNDANSADIAKAAVAATTAQVVRGEFS